MEEPKRQIGRTFRPPVINEISSRLQLVVAHVVVDYWRARAGDSPQGDFALHRTWARRSPSHAAKDEAKRMTNRAETTANAEVKSRVLEGKRILVLGIANQHSIAYGCARVFRQPRGGPCRDLSQRKGETLCRAARPGARRTHLHALRRRSAGSIGSGLQAHWR